MIVPFNVTPGLSSGTFDIGGVGTVAEGFGTPVAAKIILSGSTIERDQIKRDTQGHPIRDSQGNPIYIGDPLGTETDELLSVGFTDGTNEKVGVSFAQNAATSMVGSRTLEDALIREIDQTGAEGRAIFSSFGTDKITLQYTSAFDKAYRGYAVLMKGAHKVTVGETNVTSSGAISLGYKPTFAEFLAMDTTVYDNGQGFMSYGVSGRNGDGDPSQWCHTRFYDSGGATVNLAGGLHAGLIAAVTDDSAVSASLAMSSWDNDGFSVTLTGSAVRIAYMAVECPGDQLAFADIETLAAGDGQIHAIEPDYTGAGSGDYTEYASWIQTNTTVNGVNNDATAEGYSLGAMSQCIRQSLAAVFDDHGEATAEAGSSFSSAELGYIVTGGDTAEKLLRAYSLDDVDINTVYEVGGGAATRIGYLAVQASQEVSTCSTVSTSSTLSTLSSSTQSTLSSLSTPMSTQSSLSTESTQSSLSTSVSTLSSSQSTESSQSDESSQSLSTRSSLSTLSSISSSPSSLSTLSSQSTSSSSQSDASSLSSLSSLSTSLSSLSTESSLSSSTSSISDASSLSSLSSISTSLSSQSTSSSQSSSSIGCSDTCVWTWTAGTPDFWDIGIPCENDPLGLGSCTCDEPLEDGDFYGQTRVTKCREA